MKKIIILFFLTGLTCQIGICQSSDKKMPVTTSSDKARELFIQARDLKENIELVPGDKLLSQAIELDPDFALAHLWLNTRPGTDKAMELIRLVTPGEAFMIRSQDAIYKGDFKLASLYDDSLASLFPKDPSVLFNAGNTFFLTDNAKGVKYLEKAIAVDQNYAPAYNILGYNYMYAGDNEKAGKTFRKYLELRPKSGNGHDSYGDFLHRTGKYSEAIEQYRIAFENEPSLTASLVKTGWVHIRKGEFNLARESFNEFDRAALNDGEHLDAIIYQSLTSFIMGDMKRAFTELDAMKKKAIEVKNLFYRIFENTYKGLMLVESGNPAGAIAHFRQSHDLIPTVGLDSAGVSYQNMYNQGFLSMALAFSGQLDEAQKELALAKQIFDGRARGIQDNNFMGLFQGTLEINRKNFPKAIELLEPGAILNESAPNQYYTGLAYDLAGNRVKAIEFYTKANENLDTNFTALYLNKTKKRLEELKKLK
jgi:tetratricopeptide (TPR) repeat protein